MKQVCALSILSESENYAFVHAHVMFCSDNATWNPIGNSIRAMKSKCVFSYAVEHSPSGPSAHLHILCRCQACERPSVTFLQRQKRARPCWDVSPHSERRRTEHYLYKTVSEQDFHNFLTIGRIPLWVIAIPFSSSPSTRVICWSSLSSLASLRSARRQNRARASPRPSRRAARTFSGRTRTRASAAATPYTEDVSKCLARP
jgi:hypothetical protein